MSIEQFEPPRKRQSLLRRALSALSREKKAPPPNNWEIYNTDRSRRYCFYEWKNEEEAFRQLNVQLDYKIGRSWGTIMKAMTRWEQQEEQAFAVEVEALTSRTSGGR